MNKHARQLLEKLLHACNQADAGVRSRSPALTQSHLASYRSEKLMKAKESFETTMEAAQVQQAIRLIWDAPQKENGFIKRVDIVDPRALAVFLGHTPLPDILACVSAQLASYLERFPVLNDVLLRWSQLRTIRTLKPDSVQNWLDAVKVIDLEYEMAVEAMSVPIREASYRCFKDSKRIERLAAPVDVLLCGSVEAEPRDPSAVWEELGLFREEHPVLLAGNMIIDRERVSACLDTPYVGLPAATVRGLKSIPRQMMTIENLTTFHSEAKRRCDEEVLLIYIAGMPSPAWRAMYFRLLQTMPNTIPVFHWGDIDEGGFRIAGTLAREANAAGHTLRPWKMHPNDVPVECRRKTSTYVLERIQHFADATGWTELGKAVAEAGFTVEQEGL